MDQLGKVLQHIIANLATAKEQSKELWFSKLDIKDRFWCIIINDNNVWNFCYAMPNEDLSTPIEETSIIVPNILQLG